MPRTISAKHANRSERRKVFKSTQQRITFRPRTSDACITQLRMKEGKVSEQAQAASQKDTRNEESTGKRGSTPDTA